MAFGIGGGLLNSAIFTVDGGHQAVLFDRFHGVLEETSGEGTHFIIPWLQKAFIFDIRTRPRSITSVTGTKDLQMVNHLKSAHKARPYQASTHLQDAWNQL